MKILLYLALALLPALLSGAEKSPRSCRLIYLNAPAGAPEKLQLFDGSASREVELPRMNLSPVYGLPEGDLNLRLLPQAPASADEIPAVAPSLLVPEAIVHCYLFVVTDSSNKIAPVKMMMVEADFGKFSAGDILWLNLTSSEVAGTVGKRNLALKPGGRVLVEAPAADQENYVVNLAYREDSKSAIRPICETNWRQDARSRKVAFVFNEEGRMAPRVLAFNDFRLPSEKE